MTGALQPNRDQTALWNDAAGRMWVDMQGMLDRVFEPIATRLVDEGFPGEGGRVLDVGCGAGATTLAMVRRLGTDGRCVGLDLSRPLVDTAAQRARADGLTGAAFVHGDAQTHPFKPGEFDAVISRFGVMFFDDPESAFVNIRRATRQGGRLAFAAWRSLAENPFMTAAARAAAPLLPDLPTPVPNAPGQFAFADPDHVRRILSRSGWADIQFVRLDVPASLDRQDLFAYVTRMGPVGLALPTLDPQKRIEIIQSVLPAHQPFVQDGIARFVLACWLVTARAGL